MPASFGHRTTTLALASWARGAVPEDIPKNQRVSCCRSLKPTPPPSLQRLQAVGLGSQARARARASRVRPRCRVRRPCAPAARWLARRARTGRQGAQVHQWGLLTASVLVPLLQGGSDQDFYFGSPFDSRNGTSSVRALQCCDNVGRRVAALYHSATLDVFHGALSALRVCGIAI